MSKDSVIFDSKMSVLTAINDELCAKHNVKLFIKRDDLIHDVVSGNKWRKLKFNIARAKDLQKDGILTFGGAFSNHLVATAAACHELGLSSIGIVRGDELNSDSNETLRVCQEFGMELKFVSRSDYSLNKDKGFLGSVCADHGNYLVVPEGGANYYGMIGCQEINTEIDIQFDKLFVAQGTTTTSCGLLLGLKDSQQLNVIPVLKGFDSKAEMLALFADTAFDKGFVSELLQKVKVHSDYHFGGYAKYTEELLNFIKNFYSKYEIKLDPVYTGKALFAVYDQIKKGMLDNQRIIFLHTGGIQGAKTIVQKSGFELF